jgi:hypothetical protein
MAGPMTGNQLERFARAHRQVSAADDAGARVRRRLVWRFEEDGSLAGTFRLPPLQGAVVLKALRAAAGDLAHPDPADGEHPAGPGHPHDGTSGADGGAADVSAETPAAGQPVVSTSSNLADALVAVAEAFLAEKVAGAEDAEIYQVVVHVGTDALPPAPAEGVSAETPEGAAQPPVPGHPADPARCHVEDGPAISIGTGQMLACSSVVSWMLHDSAGKLLDLGRRRRRPNAALRRAARERDKCRCRFPGCESRRVDLHHIQYWSHGGRTELDNLISLCPFHHKLVHDRGYLIGIKPDGTFAFWRPDGTAVSACPALPPPAGTIGDWHDAEITADTIIPPWFGERLNLDYAIYTCFANAANAARRRDATSRWQ